MTIKFLTLCTFSIHHSYYEGNCRDFDFFLPQDTKQLLQNSKMLAKIVDGILYILFEANDFDKALISIEGKTLRIGLKINNPYFSNFTEFPIDGYSVQYYQNSIAPVELDTVYKLPLVGSKFSHKLTKPDRPCSATLKDRNGIVLLTDTVTLEENRDSVSYDLSGQAAGIYTVNETYPISTAKFIYYKDAEINANNASAIIEIKVSKTMYSIRPKFIVPFEARKEIVKYYIVARNYSDTEFDKLQVTDIGYSEETRPQLNFTKVASGSFTDAEIPSAFLTSASNTRLVLFKSDVLVPRQEKARKKIQLTLNGDVIIPHLPQPSADKSKSEIIIQISKP